MTLPRRGYNGRGSQANSNTLQRRCNMTIEQDRLDDVAANTVEYSLESGVSYLSERQWGNRPRGLQPRRRRLELLHPRPGPVTARSRRDGLAGTSPTTSRISASAALERKRPHHQRTPVRSTNSESNATEDVKEYYFYPRQHDPFVHEVPLRIRRRRILHATNLAETSRGLSRQDSEYELIDSGVSPTTTAISRIREYGKESPKTF